MGKEKDMYYEVSLGSQDSIDTQYSSEEDDSEGSVDFRDFEILIRAKIILCEEIGDMRNFRIKYIKGLIRDLCEDYPIPHNTFNTFKTE